VGIQISRVLEEKEGKRKGIGEGERGKEQGKERTR
jgi:hypothetical protein